MICTNELPKLDDSSTALAGRFVITPFIKSFYGNEDTKLIDRFYAEASGIFMWAIEGLIRLTERGHFVQCDSGKEMASEMEALLSPVAEFLHEWCNDDPEAETPIEELFDAWRAWCEEKNHPSGSSAVFGRDLRAVRPEIAMGRPWSTTGDRPRTYKGIRLSLAATEATAAWRAKREQET